MTAARQLIILVASLAATPAMAIYREDFESAQPTWQFAHSDASAQLTYQQRSFTQAHSGNGSEQIQIAAGRGTFAYLTLPIAPTRVIQELHPSLWLKADRPGLQLMLRVVLPRSRDPATGEPRKTLLRGDSYSQVGTWQQLGLGDVFKELERQQRVLRTQFTSDIDVREAYVDLIVLNAYGGPGLTTLWIDELVIPGHVPMPVTETSNLVRPAPRAASYPIPGERSGPAEAGPPRLSVEMRSSVLTVSGRPFMPRIIDYNGEPLEWLKSLGFNTVRLQTTPTPEMLAAAEEHDVWLVAPPPRTDAGLRVSDAFERILAWSLGHRLGPRDVRSTRQWADQLRYADERLRRPLVCGADGDLWAYSQLADAVVVEQSTFASSFQLKDYEPWLRQRRRLMRTETPLWAAVPTQATPELQLQMDMLAPTRSEPLALDANQVRLQVYAAAAAGVRGIYFRSLSPLNASTPTAQRRARTLKMINAELELLEPWCAGGSPGPAVSANDPHVRIACLVTERSQMLIVTRVAADQQYVASVPDMNPVNFTIPGATAAGDVFQVTLGGLLPLAHQRGTGGVRVVVPQAGLSTLVLVARDQLVLNHVARSLRGSSREFPQWRLEEAAHRFEQVKAANTAGVSTPDVQRLWHTIDLYLNETRRVLATGDTGSAERYLIRAESALAQVQRAAWEHAAAAFPSAVASPLCVTYETLPLHWQLSGKLREATWSGNLLAAGDFEDLNHTLSSGWQQNRRELDQVATSVEFSLESPRSGRSCLRLQAWATDRSTAPAVIESAPLWITSGPVAVEQGQLVRIQGWVKVPQPIRGSFDGLLIFDSLGGIPLAARMHQTDDWEEFVLYRIAPQAGDLRVTFALTGLGEAWLDAVTVSALPPYAAIR